MVVFDKLCRTTWSSRVYRTESVSVMGHTRMTAWNFVSMDTGVGIATDWWWFLSSSLADGSDCCNGAGSVYM